MFYTSKYSNDYYCFIDNKVLWVDLNSNIVQLVSDVNKINKINKIKGIEVTDTLTLYTLKYLANDYLLNEIEKNNKLIAEYTYLHKVINYGNVH